MYVAITGSGKARVIQFREDKRIPGTNKKVTAVIKTIGNYERMLAEDPDVIQKLKAEAVAKTKEKKEANAPIVLSLPVTDIEKSSDITQSFRFGHSIIKQLWQIMELDAFFEKNTNKRNAETVARAIYYLTAHRCSLPASVLKSSQEQRYFAGIEPLGIDVLYSVLGVLDEQKDAVIAHLAKFFERRTERKNSDVCYDVTTYSFESTKWGELRMFGFSKDHKNNEVQVVMGLLIDNNGIPITYELFSGNTMDQSTLTRSIERLKALYGLERITVVADRGLNSGGNLEYLCENGHDFVISYTLKRSTEEFKQLALDANGWKETRCGDTGEVTRRTKVIEQMLEVKVPIEEKDASETVKKRGRPRKYNTRSIPVKIHLSWTAKRAAKDRADRERILEKLNKRLDRPYQLKAAVKRGCNQYLKMEVDTSDWKIDEEKIRYSEMFDGYYAIITNNLEWDSEVVSEIYRGLWKIEESFRILKTDMQACPVYVWSDSHIRGHFAMCFLSLCMLRYMQYLLEKTTGKSLSAACIMEAISEPEVLLQGRFPCSAVTPINVPQAYIDLAKILNLPPLKTNMTLTNFRSATKLNLTKNIE